MSDNPDQNMKNEKLCSQLSTLFQKSTWDLGAGRIRARGPSTVLRAAGESEISQENIQDCLELDFSF
jgi:hypothetical protein